MNYISLLLYFSCFYTLTYAARLGTNYFNSTAHALRVYGHSFYNPMTRKSLQGVIEDDQRLPLAQPKISFRGLPCACLDMNCGCCAGLNITQINLDRTYCANMTFDPKNFAVDVNVLMNNDEIFNTVISGRNPPPICVPLPWFPLLNFCLRLYDLSLPGNSNVQSCIDFEARVAMSPLMVLHFNCVQVGPGGVSWMKPSDIEEASNSSTVSGGDSSSGTNLNTGYIPNTGDSLITVDDSNTGDKPDASDDSKNSTLITKTTAKPALAQIAGVHDAVNFEKMDEPSDGYPVNGTTLSPEDEDKIGEHRIT